MLRFVGGGVGWGGWVVWGLSLVESNPPVNLCQMLANSFLTKGRKKNSCWARLINQLAKSVMNIMFSFFTEVPHFHIFVIQVNLIILGLFLTVCCHAFTF